MRLRIRHVIFVSLMSLSIWQLFEAGYIHAKAWIAQQLIQVAWDDTVTSANAQQPWPWADTQAVARLTAKDGTVDLVVLSGTSGRTLAFGPGHMAGTALPGSFGNVVVSGHRDTHFSFLKHLGAGDQLTLQSTNGNTKVYEVIGTEVVHQNNVAVAMDAGDDRITLITCYPFDAPIPGGPMRYVVVARSISTQYLEI